jgi:hypothetical protein
MYVRGGLSSSVFTVAWYMTDGVRHSPFSGQVLFALQLHDLMVGSGGAELEKILLLCDVMAAFILFIQL